MDPYKAHVSTKALRRVIKQQQASQKKTSSLSNDQREFRERTATTDDDVWVQDRHVTACQATKCQGKSSKFTLLNRRHHCRRCGKIFCGTCTQNKIPIHGNLKRVCNSCYRDALTVDCMSPGFKHMSGSSFKPLKDSDGGVRLLSTSSDPKSLVADRLKGSGSDGSKDAVPKATITDKRIGAKKNTEGSPAVLSYQLSASSDSTRSSILSMTEDHSKTLPGLVDAILVISDDINGDSELQAMRPRECLPTQVIEEIVSLAIPAGLSREKTTELNFMFRVKNDIAEEALRISSHDILRHQEIEKEPDVFYNCYVSFAQRSLDADSGTSGNESSNDCSSTYRLAIVLVSHWPSPQLFFEILHKLDEAFFLNILNRSQGNEEGYDSTEERNEIGMSSIIQMNGFGNNRGILSHASDNLVVSAAMQFAMWPVPTAESANNTLTLPFMGETFNHLLPAYLPICHTPEIGLQFEGINLVSLLGPLGLLQHIWTLWAMIVTGESILVLATSRAQCSEVSVALSTLMHPVTYKGDLRPVMNMSNPECIRIGRAARDAASMTTEDISINKKRNRKIPATNFSILGYENAENVIASENLLPTHGIIAGTEDTALLQVFNRFTAVLFLPPPILCLENDSLRTGLQVKNAAELTILRETDSYESCMAQWIGRGSRRTIFATRKPLSGLTKKMDQNSVLKRLRSMSNRERTVLGDKLIKDRLKEMTINFVKWYTEGTGTFMSDEKKKKIKQETTILQSMHNRAYLSNREPSINKLGLKYGHTKDRWIDEKDEAQNDPSATVQEIATIPTLLYWVLIALLVYKLVVMGLIALTVFAAFIGEIQYIAPPYFDAILLTFIPQSYLYPFRKVDAQESDKKGLTSNSTVAEVHVVSTKLDSLENTGENDSYDDDDTSSAMLGGKVDMSGVWKRVKCENVDNYVGAQGAGYLQRKLAASISMTHTITCDETLSAFRIQEKAGPIDTDYILVAGDSERKKNEVVQKFFLDKIYWKDGKLLQHRVIESGEYELLLSRTRDGNQIILNQLHRDLITKVETVATSWFEYSKPSPNQKLPRPVLPPIVNKIRNDEYSDVVFNDISPSASSSLRTDLSGVWNRVNTQNFDAFIGAQGAGYFQRKLAVSMKLTHTITMKESSFELKEVGGPLNNISKLCIGADDFVDVTLMKKKYREKAFWEGDVLVIQRVHVDNDHEMVLRRYLEGTNGETIRLVSLHRNLKNGQEVEAVSMFSKEK